MFHDVSEDEAPHIIRVLMGVAAGLHVAFVNDNGNHIPQLIVQSVWGLWGVDGVLLLLWDTTKITYPKPAKSASLVMLDDEGRQVGPDDVSKAGALAAQFITAVVTNDKAAAEAVFTAPFANGDIETGNEMIGIVMRMVADRSRAMGTGDQAGFYVKEVADAGIPGMG